MTRRIAQFTVTLLSVAVATVGCDHRQLDAVRDRIMRADHQAILVGCREILAHRQTYRVNPHYNGGEQSLRGVAPDPQDPQIPEAIRNLQPTFIEIFDDSVHLGFAAGGHRADVTAFASGVDDKVRGPQIGRGRALVSGLWYYEDL
jgi:hypothetical protein